MVAPCSSQGQALDPPLREGDIYHLDTATM
jgi:hypothetical protein